MPPSGRYRAIVPTNGLVFDKRTPAKILVTAEATRKGNPWTVILSRKLNAGHTAGRYHYVSFERTPVVNSGAADFIAK